MIPVGYLLNKREGLAGDPGVYYDYIVAGNGLFVRASSPLLGATVQVAEATVRGLEPLAETVDFPHGMIPRMLADFAIKLLAENPLEERFLAVRWQEGTQYPQRYHLSVPHQEGTGASVTYERLPRTVLDIHSHGTMPAWFSPTDNDDEQGLGLYMVVGKLHTLFPEFMLRVGVYGYFRPLEKAEVFE